MLETDWLAFRSLEQMLAVEDIAVRLVGPGAALQCPWNPEACLLVDGQASGVSYISLLNSMRERRNHVPVIVITARGDVRMAVEAMRAGALDCIETPVERSAILTGIRGALARSRVWSRVSPHSQEMTAGLASLTPRQRQIMDLVLAGEPSKNIAADLGISQRTVESHGAEIMRKTGTRSLPALTRLVLAAAAAVDDPTVLAAASSLSTPTYVRSGSDQFWKSSPAIHSGHPTSASPRFTPE
jgi:two-component system CheB/CheR fusion protein